MRPASLKTKTLNGSRANRPSSFRKVQKMSRRPWTEDEIKLARKMRAAGHPYEEVDWAFRRRADLTKRQAKGADHGHNVSICVPDSLLAERDALVAARDRGAVAQNFFSDLPRRRRSASKIAWTGFR